MRIGHGEDFWRWATGEVLQWGVKTRSGFDVTPSAAVAVGDMLVIVARPMGLPIREPVEVVAVVRSSHRAGFAYRTLSGHPVSGEEAFVVTRSGDSVSLTIRSLTRPSDRIAWRLAYPVLLLAQRVARRRYLAALLAPTASKSSAR